MTLLKRKRIIDHQQPQTDRREKSARVFVKYAQDIFAAIEQTRKLACFAIEGQAENLRFTVTVVPAPQTDQNPTLDIAVTGKSVQRKTVRNVTLPGRRARFDVTVPDDINVLKQVLIQLQQHEYAFSAQTPDPFPGYGKLIAPVPIGGPFHVEHNVLTPEAATECGPELEQTRNRRDALIAALHLNDDPERAGLDSYDGCFTDGEGERIPLEYHTFWVTADKLQEITPLILHHQIDTLYRDQQVDREQIYAQCLARIQEMQAHFSHNRDQGRWQIQIINSSNWILVSPIPPVEMQEGQPVIESAVWKPTRYCKEAMLRFAAMKQNQIVDIAVEAFCGHSQWLMAMLLQLPHLPQRIVIGDLFEDSYRAGLLGLALNGFVAEPISEMERRRGGLAFLLQQLFLDHQLPRNQRLVVVGNTPNTLEVANTNVDPGRTGSGVDGTSHIQSALRVYATYPLPPRAELLLLTTSHEGPLSIADLAQRLGLNIFFDTRGITLIPAEFGQEDPDAIRRQYWAQLVQPSPFGEKTALARARRVQPEKVGEVSDFFIPAMIVQVGTDTGETRNYALVHQEGTDPQVFIQQLEMLQQARKCGGPIYVAQVPQPAPFTSSVPEETPQAVRFSLSPVQGCDQTPYSIQQIWDVSLEKKMLVTVTIPRPRERIALRLGNVARVLLVRLRNLTNKEAGLLRVEQAIQAENRQALEPPRAQARYMQRRIQTSCDGWPGELPALGKRVYDGIPRLCLDPARHLAELEAALLYTPNVAHGRVNLAAIQTDRPIVIGRRKQNTLLPDIIAQEIPGTITIDLKANLLEVKLDPKSNLMLEEWDPYQHQYRIITKTVSSSNIYRFPQQGRIVFEDAQGRTASVILSPELAITLGHALQPGEAEQALWEIKDLDRMMRIWHAQDLCLQGGHLNKPVFRGWGLEKPGSDLIPQPSQMTKENAQQYAHLLLNATPEALFYFVSFFQHSEKPLPQSQIKPQDILYLRCQALMIAVRLGGRVLVPILIEEAQKREKELNYWHEQLMHVAMYQDNYFKGLYYYFLYDVAYSFSVLGDVFEHLVPRRPGSSLPAIDQGWV